MSIFRQPGPVTALACRATSGRPFRLFVAGQSRGTKGFQPAGTRRDAARIKPLTLALMMSAAWPVWAADIETGADAPTSTNPGGAPQLEQVVVTAQKRAEVVEAVPVSVSVLSGEQLKAQRIANYDDLSRAVPGVSFNAVGASEGLTNVTIRGVSSTSGSATVGLYLDDVSITTKNFYDFAAQPRFYDLQSIEVLRGPQGSLWGASSEGGTIRFVPVEPDMFKQSGLVTLDGSGTRHGGANGSIGAVFNVPINPDVFALRGSLYSGKDSGYIDHYDTNGNLTKKGVNTDLVTSIHLVGKLTPNNELTIKPAIFYQTNRTGDNAAFYPELGLYQQDKKVVESSHDQMSLASLSARYKFGAFDLTSVTGDFRRNFSRQEDGSYYNATLFAQAFLDPLYPQYQAQNDAQIGTLASPVQSKSRYKQLSQELRLSSSEDSTSPLKWVGGLYYADQSIHNTNFQQIPGINAVFQGIYGIPMEQSLVQASYGAPGLLLFPDDIDESDKRTYRERQVAVFGQIDYDLTRDWHVGLGGRFVRAEESFQSTEIGFYQIGNISPYDQSARFSSFTPKATLSHELDAGSAVYASVGKGSRLGGPTGPIVYGPTSVCAGDFAAIGQTEQPTKFDSDSLVTYEFGSKNLLANNRVSINASVFRTSWHNIQQQIYLPTCGYYFTANVGDARILGGELEAVARVSRELTVNLTFSRESARITSTNNASTAPIGAALINVPWLTYTLGATYGFNLTEDTKIVARADYAYTGHSFGSYQATNPNYDNPSYGVLNVGTSLVTRGYEVTLYAKNALNNQTIIQRPQINTVIEGYTVRPRTVGLTATAKF